MVRPPHYIAYINGMRPIFDNELYSKISPGTIKINPLTYQQEELNEEWYEYQAALELFEYINT